MARSRKPWPISSSATANNSPLTGLRCIELSWVWSGPMAAQILGDLGAEVIKVESFNRFDLYRTRGRKPCAEKWMKNRT